MIRRALATMALVCALGTSARAQVKLEYKATEGATHRIKVESKVDQVLSIAGQDVKTQSHDEAVVTSATGKRKDDGTLPIVGVNTFVNPDGGDPPDHLELARSSEEEKQGQLARLRDFQARHSADRPAALVALQQAVLAGQNVFEELMETVRHASLGEISTALFDVGGSYRRSVQA